MYHNSVEKMKIVAQYAAKGWKILPNHVVLDGKCSCFKGLECPSPGKHPATAHGFRDGTSDPEKLKEFFGDDVPKNIGVATGEPSGFAVVDVDGAEGLQTLKEQEEKYGLLPQTVVQKTGSGVGRQYFFKFDSRWEKKKNSVKFLPSLDIRITGGQVLLPPSLHQSGNRYEWIVSPWEQEMAVAPQWLLDLIPDRDEPAKKSVGPVKIEKAKTLADRAVLYLAETPVAVAGQNGHGVTFGVCCRLCELFPDLSEDELFDSMTDWNQRCTPPWSESDLKRKISQAKKKIPEAR